MTGYQEPPIWWCPEFEHTRGHEVIELAESAGLHLDPWQQFVVVRACAVTADPDETDDWAWSAFEVGVDVGRQNGKGGIIEAIELGALFAFEDPLTTHTAHLFDTSLEAFMRLEDLIAGTPELSKQVQRVARSHGEEGITLMNPRRRIRFRTRTKGGGRGFSGEKVILDEAMVISEQMHGALLPTVSARQRPQVYYFGTAVDQEVHEHGIPFARVRDRGHKHEGGVAWFEWAATPTDDDGVPLGPNDIDYGHVADPELWAQANPALGIRITEDYLKLEGRSLAPRTFAVERLGIGDWPNLEALAGQGLTIEAWQGCIDRRSKTSGPVCFAFDVTPKRTAASISVAGYRQDGRPHAELVDRRPGTDWVVPRLLELLQEHDAVEPVCDANSPAASLVAKLGKEGVAVVTTSGPEHAQACGMLFDAVTEAKLRHLGQPELDAAVRGAIKRPLGEAWAWSRSKSSVDISPLVSVTLANWGLETQEPKSKVPLVAMA